MNTNPDTMPGRPPGPATLRRPDATAERIFHIALAAFRERGFDAVEMAGISAAAGVTLDDIYRRYPHKESLILRLYEQLVTDLEERVAELPPAGRMHERFRAILTAKLEAAGRHRELLRHLLPAMLDPGDPLGVLGRHGDAIRSRNQAVFAAVVHGASDRPDPARCTRAIRMLYGLHLGLVFIHLQDQGEEARLARNALDIATDLIDLAARFFGRPPGTLGRLLARAVGLPDLDDLSHRIDRVVGGVVTPPHDSTHFGIADNVLRDLFRFRRLQTRAGACAEHPCDECLALHRPRVEARVAAGESVHLVLPAFPAKSANLRKVTGALPDLGEELALRFLQARCDDIAARHPAGARLTICSDGRVFSDLVGVSDDAVTAYRARLLEMIADLELDSIDVCDLDDVHPDLGQDFGAMRTWLVEHYAETPEALGQRTERHDHHRQLFNGIHRFLTEDLSAREPDLSRSQARKRAKEPAYEVIRRSNAWSRLIAGFFPDALRLSIHPQPPHSDKIGILLTPAEDVWLTPWHGVALLQANRFVLTRRAEAEAMGARLVERDGRPSHFETPT